jgi:pimeloyl-ACP methyl ester carboxylesterase
VNEATAAGYAEAAAFTLEHPERPGLVLALHGLTGTRTQPLGLLEGFDDPDWGVLSPDMRAHGETAFIGRPEDFTPQRLAADMVELIDRLGLRSRRVVALGISLGATIALELLRSRALDLAGCVFVRPAHAAAHPVHLDVNLEIARYLREDPSAALERLLASRAYVETEAVSPSVAASLRQKVTQPLSVERVMRLERGAWQAFRPDEEVVTLVPVLIVAARKDPLHPIPLAENWHRRIPDSRLVLAPSRDEDPDGNKAIVNSAISTFIVEAGRARGVEW